MTKDRLFKKEYAIELLAVARDDLQGAEILASSVLKRQELTLFHVQQSIEKSLKALLCWLEKPVPMVNSISIILDRLPSGYHVPHADDLEDLTQFATIRRYEEGVALLTTEEISAAIQAAHDIIGWVERTMNQIG